MKPSISAIIPTTLRPELSRAIESAIAQEDVDVEVVVVVDRPDADSIPYVDTQVITGGGAGGARSRNLGVAKATGEFVAFLDDDDYWLPSKSNRQLALLNSTDRPAIVSSRVRQTSPAADRSGSALPARLVTADERVEDYLFRKRRPSPLRASLFTSTLLCRRDVAESVAWDEALRRHQDWDWLCHAQRVFPSMAFLQCADALVRIQVGSGSSISSSADWKSSLDWFLARGGEWSPNTQSDFLAAQTLRYALQSRSKEGVTQTLRRIRATKRVPSFSAMACGVAGLLDRQTLNSLLTRPAAQRTR